MRIKEYRISLRHILMMLMAGNKLPDVVCVTRANLPEDSKAHHIEPGRGGMYLSVFVEHESFPELQEGEAPPYADEGCGFHMEAFPVMRVDETTKMILGNLSLDDLKELREYIECCITDKEDEESMSRRFNTRAVEGETHGF